MLQWTKNLPIAFAALTIGFLLGQFWDMPYRFALMKYFQETYGEHVFQCDSAMREHFIAKSRVSSNPTESNIVTLEATEFGLLDCHNYDKFRKQLIGYGLSENDLSTMGLIAIEASRSDLSKLVEQHEIRY